MLIILPLIPLLRIRLEPYLMHRNVPPVLTRKTFMKFGEFWTINAKISKILRKASKDWDGNIGNRQEGVNGMWGSAVEITDNIVSEGKALWDNPGQFLMTRILGKD